MTVRAPAPNVVADGKEPAMFNKVIIGIDETTAAATRSPSQATSLTGTAG